MTKPDHVEESQRGAYCMSCGGQVGPEGFALGGEVEDHQNVEPMETEQQMSTESMRDAAFADALSRRPHGSMGEGAPPVEMAKAAGPFGSEEMRRKKAEHYGRSR